MKFTLNTTRTLKTYFVILKQFLTNFEITFGKYSDNILFNYQYFK